MSATKDELKKVFAKNVKTLISELREWYDEETASIDGSAIASAPSGTGGSLIGTGAAIDSKRVVDATIITNKVLSIELPPEIIKPGGYDSFDDMIDDLIPKLEKVFIGETKIKKHKPVKELESV